MIIVCVCGCVHVQVWVCEDYMCEVAYFCYRYTWIVSITIK